MSARVLWLAPLLALAAGCAARRLARDLGPNAPEVQFSGNASFDDTTLLATIVEDLKHIERRSSPRAAIDDAAFHLGEFYRGEGYPFSEVDYEVDELEGAKLRARFLIVEGPRTTIEQLEFEGNLAFDDEQLADFLRAPRAGTFDSGEAYYLERALDNLVDGVAAFYYSAGYLDSRVSPPRAEFDATREHARVMIGIHEGTRYFVDSVRLEGGLADVERDVDLKRFRGSPYAPQIGRTLRGRIEELYASRGHPDARCELLDASLDPDSGRVSLRYSVEPGQRVRIATVRIEGNEETRDGFIRGCLELEPGDLYDVREERESTRNLFRTGIFDSVRLQLEGQGPERTLVVQVEEAASTELYVEPGYGSYERFRLGLGWRERNVFGTGRTFDVDGTVAELAQRGSLGLTDPRFLDSDIEAHVSVFSNRREEPSFTSFELGSAASFTKHFTEHVSGNFTYQFRSSQVSDVKVLDPVVQQALSNVDISSITVGPTYDTRDHPVLTRRGTLARVSLEYADERIGSELDFARLRFNWSRFLESGADRVLGLSWRGGLIAPLKDTSQIPLQERFFNGGENTVRSFEEQKLGPLDLDGDPIGGEAYNVLSAELRQRLRGNLEGALFYDTGNLILNYEDYLEFNNFRHAIGVGLRYLLPVGPVRLDVGFNPDPRAFEEDYVVHFSVGMAF